MRDLLLDRQNLKLLRTQNVPSCIRETSRIERILRRRKGQFAAGGLSLTFLPLLSLLLSFSARMRMSLVLTQKRTPLAIMTGPRTAALNIGRHLAMVKIS
jgi:hypothetical protein